MPAMAITEHGNMFSSVIFHDQARKRGINPILGCEVYVAPGDRRTKSGTPGETANHLVLLAETSEGYHNLIKLVSSGYTEGFYYKPRIDKDLLAQHAKGLIGLSSCLKGEVATGLRTEQPHKALGGRGRLPRHPRAARTSSSRCSIRASTSRRGRTSGCSRSPGTSGSSGRHQRRPLPAELRLQAARHPAVHRHRQDGQRHRAAALPRRPVLPEDRRGDGGRSSPTSPTPCAAPCEIAAALPRRLAFTENYLPNFDVPPGFTLDDYFEHMVRQGFEPRLPRLQAAGRARRAQAHHRRIRAPAVATKST